MAISINGPIAKSLLTVASTAVTATSANFTIPIADSYTFYLNVTTATAGTMDVVFQTSVDGGTTYVNVPWRFAQVATTTGAFVLNVNARGSGFTTDTSAGITAAAGGTGNLVADTGGATALQAIVDPRFMKVKYTIATGPDAFILYCIAWPKGATSGSD